MLYRVIFYPLMCLTVLSTPALGQAHLTSHQSNVPSEPGINLGGDNPHQMNLPTDNSSAGPSSQTPPQNSGTEPQTKGQIPTDCSKASLTAKLETAGEVLKILLGDRAFADYVKAEDTSDPQRQLAARMDNIRQFVEGMKPHVGH